MTGLPVMLSSKEAGGRYFKGTRIVKSGKIALGIASFDQHERQNVRIA